MKTITVTAKDAKGTILGEDKCKQFDTIQELIGFLENSKTLQGVKDKVLTDVNRQRKTDVRNKLAQEGKPVSDKTLIVRGLKSGQIPASEAAALIKKFNL